MKIGITMGDPKGVGPEIIAKAWKNLPLSEREHLRIYGDRTALDAAAEMSGIEFNQKQLVVTSSAQPPIGAISDAEAARITKAALDASLADARNGDVAAIVTGPVNKARLQNILPEFTGHTEYLAETTDSREVVMMFAADAPAVSAVALAQPLRVALATTHVPIKSVAHELSGKKIITAIKKLHEALIDHFGCKYPRIGVLSLNPHAGDRGALGSEEETVILPAIDSARSSGINCIGPLVIDTLFAKVNQLDFDGVVAMYHDQGLIPMKILYGLKTVNVTLGLPFVRTSPAHGTAEDIAWRDMASPESMIAAIKLAERMTTKGN